MWYYFEAYIMESEFITLFPFLNHKFSLFEKSKTIFAHLHRKYTWYSRAITDGSHSHFARNLNEKHKQTFARNIILYGSYKWSRVDLCLSSIWAGKYIIAWPIIGPVCSKMSISNGLSQVALTIEKGRWGCAAGANHKHKPSSKCFHF